jgi:predicted Mrr-cat superfamily restriction endonuclease
MTIWGMWLKPGGSEGRDLTAQAVLGNFILIGWDWPHYAGLTNTALHAALSEYYKREREKKPEYVAGQMFSFLREITPKQDLVIVPRYKRDEYYVGRILGRIKEQTVDGYRKALTRHVEWFNPRSPWKKSALPKTFRLALRKRQTIWDLTEFGHFLKQRIRRPPERDPRTPNENGRFDTLGKAFSYFLKGGRKKVFPGPQWSPKTGQ